MTCKSILRPDWALPDNVGAAVTTRQFGNLAVHVNDDPAKVILNRRRLVRALNLSINPQYLTQQHTNHVSRWPTIDVPSDAIVSDARMTAHDSCCAVLTADCLPILISSLDGQEIAGVHAGWRGLAAGVLINSIKAMSTPAHELTLWVGPAICAQCFEVGDDVRQAFQQQFTPAQIQAAFHPYSGKWLADLPLLAEFQAQDLGVAKVTQSGLCTYCNHKTFYSYRRNRDAGRLASIIWRKST